MPLITKKTPYSETASSKVLSDSSDIPPMDDMSKAMAGAKTHPITKTITIVIAPNIALK
jgi:hypothetical protein